METTNLELYKIVSLRNDVASGICFMCECEDDAGTWCGTADGG